MINGPLVDVFTLVLIDETACKPEILPAILENTSDFDNGIADLGSLQLTYNGASGDNVLYAEAGDVLSRPAHVVFNNVFFSVFEGVPSYVTVGEPLRLSPFAFNYGNLIPDGNIQYYAYFKSCPEICRDFGEFPPIDPDDSTIFNLILPTDDLVSNADDTLIIGMTTNYSYEGNEQTTKYEKSFSLRTIAPFQLTYVNHSLSVDTLLSPSLLENLEISFNTSAPIDIYPNSIPGLVLSMKSQGGIEIPLVVENQSAAYENGVLHTVFGGVNVADISEYGITQPGYFDISISGAIYTPGMPTITFERLNDFDSVDVEIRSDYYYIENTLAPLTLLYDTTQSFLCDINVSGSVDIVLDSFNSRFELQHSDGILTSFLYDQLILHPGVNRIKAGGIYIPENLVGQELMPRLILNGYELYANRTDTILFDGQKIVVSDQTVLEPWLRITGAELNTIRPPYVNYNQEFGISISIENLSDSNVDSVSIYIKSENGQVIYAELHDISIPANSVISHSFTLNAPDYSVPLLIYKAEIESNYASILPPLDNIIAVTVQSPASIELSYDLRNTNGPYVDYYQTFSIEAELHNRGEAAADMGEVSLITGGYDFGISDSTALMLLVDSIATFDLLAPAQSLATDLLLKITEIPVDKNTGQPALVYRDSALIPIIVEPGEAELIIDPLPEKTPLIKEGSFGQMVSLKLRNNTQNQLNIVGMNTITIDFTDRAGHSIAPNDIMDLTQSGFFLEDSKITEGNTVNDRLVMTFDNYTLDPSVTDTIDFVAQFNDDIPYESFMLHIDRRDVRAIFVEGPRVNQLVPVSSESGESYKISENYVVVNPGLGNSLLTKNNPFNPAEGPAEIGYLLDEDARVTMTLYTLLGEKVYETTFNEGSEGGRQGQNLVFWDGKNDEGHMVLNGVYVLVIHQSGTDKTYKLKLAVMK